MSIASIAANAGISAATTLAARANPTPFKPPAGALPATGTDPTQPLAADLQAWLTQLQSGGAPQGAQSPRPHLHLGGDPTQASPQNGPGGQPIGPRLAHDLARAVRSYAASGQIA